MKIIRILALVLLILFGAASLTFAQDKHEQEPQKQEKQVKPQKQQKQQVQKQDRQNQKVQEKQAKPERAQRQEQRQEARPETKDNRNGQYARSGQKDSRGHEYDEGRFGREHRTRFQENGGRYYDGRREYSYGGYWFYSGFYPPWFYTQDVYFVMGADGLWYAVAYSDPSLTFQVDID